MMPYIKPKLRETLDPLINELQAHCESIGEINYVITKILHQRLERIGLCYMDINEAIGVLECAKLELYRMVAAPYENKKRFDNGCISELDTVDGKSY